MSIAAVQRALTLSKGCVLDTYWKGDFTGATATSIKFYDWKKNVIATVTGTVSSTRLTYLYTNTATLDTIPHGTPYELFVTVSGHTYMHSFGNVVRRDPAFYPEVT